MNHYSNLYQTTGIIPINKILYETVMWRSTEKYTWCSFSFYGHRSVLLCIVIAKGLAFIRDGLQHYVYSIRVVTRNFRPPSRNKSRRIRHLDSEFLLGNSGRLLRPTKDCNCNIQGGKTQSKRSFDSEFLLGSSGWLLLRVKTVTVTSELGKPKENAPSARNSYSGSRDDHVNPEFSKRHQINMAAHSRRPWRFPTL